MDPTPLTTTLVACPGLPELFEIIKPGTLPCNIDPKFCEVTPFSFSLSTTATEEDNSDRLFELYPTTTTSSKSLTDSCNETLIVPDDVTGRSRDSYPTMVNTNIPLPSGTEIR